MRHDFVASTGQEAGQWQQPGGRTRRACQCSGCSEHLSWEAWGAYWPLPAESLTFGRAMFFQIHRVNPWDGGIQVE
jgi:hypothetical protein